MIINLNKCNVYPYTANLHTAESALYLLDKFLYFDPTVMVCGGTTYDHEQKYKNFAE